MNPGRTCLRCSYADPGFRVQVGKFTFNGCSLGYYPKPDWLELWRLSLFFGGQKSDHSEKGMHLAFGHDCVDYQKIGGKAP